MEKRRRKVSVFKEHVKNLSDVTHDLTKLILYFTVVTVLGTFLVQLLGAIYIRGPMPSLPIYYPENAAVEESIANDRLHQDSYDNEKFEVDNLEKHFGLLLPKEDLEETVQVSESHNHDDDKNRSTQRQPLNMRSELFPIYGTVPYCVKAAKHKATIDARYEEAMLAVKKAQELARSGNKKLASKLFQHAIALEPEFADALTGYGEFLEDDNNIIQADLLYQRALTYEPSHVTALANRERTMPVVEELDKSLLSEIDKKKSELYKYPPHSKALRRAMREFYYEHIYHTVALEGNSLTIDEIKEIINSRNGIAGRSLREHNEVIGVDEALKYLNSTLLLKYGAITIEQIKELHKRVIGFVDPVNAGVFRSNQVYVGKHIPPHPGEVPLYMQEFSDWLNSVKSRKMHPVEFAAVAHYKLVYIHPFIDGNGRTSRLLMNMILMRNGFPPVSIRVSDRWVYYETLEAANHGDLRPFIRFIARCVSFTLDGYLLAAEDLPYYPELNSHNIILDDIDVS